MDDNKDNNENLYMKNNKILKLKMKLGKARARENLLWLLLGISWAITFAMFIRGMV